MRAKSLFCAFPIYRITNPTNGLKTTRCHIYIWAHIFLKVHPFTYFKLTTLSQCRSLSSLFFLIVSLPHSPSPTPHLGSSSSYSTSSVSFPPSSPPPLYTSALYLSCSSSTCLSLVHTLSQSDAWRCRRPITALSFAARWETHTSSPDKDKRKEDEMQTNGKKQNQESSDSVEAGQVKERSLPEERRDF